jgi:hypothetical protein
MTTALATYLQITTAAGTNIYKWQSFWPDQTVDTYTFYPFDIGSLLSARNSEQTDLQVRLPMNATTVTLAETGIEDGYLATVTLYKFTLAAGQTLPASKTAIASYTGQIIGASLDQVELTLTLGSPLDAREAQAPPRKFTTNLVGTPPLV